MGQFETQTDSYFLVNISGSHDLNFLDNLTLGWSVDNLFDKVELETKLKLLTDRSIMSGVLSISPYGKNDYAFSFIGKIEAKDSLFKNLESNYSSLTYSYSSEAFLFICYFRFVFLLLL